MDNVLYNHKVKEDFLSEYKDQSRATYLNVLSKAKTTEELYKKDLCNFTLDEIKEVLFETNPNTINSAISNGSIIRTYINWAIEKGHRSGNINPLSTIQSDWYEQFIDKNKKLYINEEELDYIISKLVNAQDAVILMLLFLGVRGYKASEIVNLTEKDIDWDNGVLKLKDDRDGERELILDQDNAEKYLRLIRQALKDTEYQQKNGQSESLNPIMKLTESDHVVRNIARRSHDKVNEHTVYRRVAMIKEFFDYPFLTPMNIEKSGMIKVAKDIYLRDGVLENEQLREILLHFNIQPKLINGSLTYQYNLYRSFLNIDTIKELYNIE